MGYFWWKESAFPHFHLRVINVVVVPIIYLVCESTYLHWIYAMETDGEAVYNVPVFAVGAALISLTSLFWLFFIFFFCIAACGRVKDVNDTKVQCSFPTCACGTLPILCILRDFATLIGAGHVLNSYAHVPIHLVTIQMQDTGSTVDAPHITDYRTFNSGILVGLSLACIVCELLWIHYDCSRGLSIDRIISVKNIVNKAQAQKKILTKKQIRSDDEV